MEVTCTSTFSSPSRLSRFLSLQYRDDSVSRSNFSNISGSPGHHWSFTRRRGLHYLQIILPTVVDLKQTPTLPHARGVERGEDFGSMSSKKSSSLGFAPCGVFSAAILSTMGAASKRRKSIDKVKSPVVCKSRFDSEQDVDRTRKPVTRLYHESRELALGGQIACWVVTIVYVGWLFLLPYAPGDPVWAISPATLQDLIDLSLNFFFVLPIISGLSNAAGFHGLTSPVLHPTSEALFNFVIGWSLLFAPILFTDRKRDRFAGSLETLWIIQMFLTNTVLAPYMAIRQSKSPVNRDKASLPLGLNFDILSTGMTRGAYSVGIVGALVGFLSILWAFIGRPEAGFGGLVERWEYFRNYVGSERLAYAFLWDIALYAVFQPWLIGDNLDNVKIQSRESVRICRFIPYVGLVVYVLALEQQDTPEVEKE